MTSIGQRFGTLVRVAVVGLVAVGAGGSFATAAATTRPAQTTEAAETLRILVTNDDGVGAPGIAAVVNALQALPDVEVTVIAPATNQSGTGINLTSGPLTVAPAVTSSGDAATAVSGTPSDTVLYGVLAAMPEPPHVVVSGINQGQNLGNITEISGTVGAGRTANRLGIPAIALSQGFAPTIKYGTAAIAANLWVAGLRDLYLDESRPARTLNLNIPSCPAGLSTRGLLVLPLGRSSDVVGYSLQSGSVGNGTFNPTISSKNPVATSDCASTAVGFDNDIDAFNNGYITATVVNPDLSDR